MPVAVPNVDWKPRVHAPPKRNTRFKSASWSRKVEPWFVQVGLDIFPEGA